MPFTAAHPAIIIHIVDKRHRLLFPSAMIIGTMAPDFEYFIHLRPLSTIGHTPWGFILLNLPMALAVYFLWDKIIRRSFLGHLPEYLQASLNPLETMDNRLTSAKQLFIFAINALFGMMTHVLWDSFTHDGGHMVSRVPLLSARFLDIPVFKYLQHGSTLLGFLWMAIFLMSIRKPRAAILQITSPNTIKASITAKQKTRFMAFWSVMSFASLLILEYVSSVEGIGSHVVILIDSMLLGLTFTCIRLRNTCCRTHMHNGHHQ